MDPLILYNNSRRKSLLFSLGPDFCLSARSKLSSHIQREVTLRCKSTYTHWWNATATTHTQSKQDRWERDIEESSQSGKRVYLTVDFGLLGVLARLPVPPLSAVSPSERSPHLLSSHTHPPHALSPIALSSPPRPFSLSPHTHVSPECCRPTLPLSHAHTHTSVWWRADFAGCGDGEGTGGREGREKKEEGEMWR